MDAPSHTIPFLLMAAGLFILFALVIKTCFEKIHLPPLTAYLVMGMGLQMADARYGFMDASGVEVLEFLSSIGVFVILFQAGLKCDPRSLFKQMGRAKYIWLGNIVVSGGLAYATARWFLDFSVLPSLFAAVALTATSVGVSVGIWQSQGKLDSREGSLLLDVAEMDDISGILLMAVLFAAAPALKEGWSQEAFARAGGAGLQILGLFVIFAGLCAAFSIFVEPGLTGYIKKRESPQDYMLMLTTVGLCIAALAGMLGLSIAIGGFLAGLSFSRDPKAVCIESSFRSIRDIFTPFFFLHIGFQIDPQAWGQSGQLALILLLVAFVGKFLGTYPPSRALTNGRVATLLGISMAPRAEIAMVVLSRGRDLGPWATPPELFSAGILVSGATSLITPLLLRPLMRNWQPPSEPA